LGAADPARGAPGAAELSILDGAKDCVTRSPDILQMALQTAAGFDQIGSERAAVELTNSPAVKTRVSRYFDGTRNKSNGRCHVDAMARSLRRRGGQGE
jgi:hypothetical protein